ncbi:hypothetical protein ACI2K6_16720 [Microbacterium sp. NPDC006705]|uniref:hypothetical protein n=1 Tax=Micrococcales TaxID=85006 RepID=UPI00379616ED
MTDTDKTDDQNTELMVRAMVYVPGRGLLNFDHDYLADGMARVGLDKARTVVCFTIQGADRSQKWAHVYSAVVGDDAADTLRNEGAVRVPLSVQFQGGGALVIEHEDEGFVRAYGPGTWARIYRSDEEIIEVEGEGSPSIE